MNYRTKINDYLSGKMTPAEKDILEQELISNENLQEAFFEMLTPAYAEQHLRQNIRAQIQASSTKRSSYFPLIAASIMLILGISFFLSTHSFAPRHSMDYFIDYPVPGKTRGKTSNVRPEAYHLFEEKNYSKAYAAFMSLDETPQINLYRGICLLHHHEINKRKAAIPFLLKVLHSGTNLDQTADWFLAIAYFQTGEKEKAKKIFLKISRDKTHYNHDKAKEFLGTYY